MRHCISCIFVIKWWDEYCVTNILCKLVTKSFLWYFFFFLEINICPCCYKLLCPSAINVIFSRDIHLNVDLCSVSLFPGTCFTGTLIIWTLKDFIMKLT